MSEESWAYKGYTVIEGPADGQPLEPFTYVFRIEQGGTTLARFTIVGDAASVKAHWADLDPARAGDIDAMWGAFSSEGFVRVRALIDSGVVSNKTLTLRGAGFVES